MATTNQISSSQIVLPVFILAVVLFLTLGFQSFQVMRDRDSLHAYITQQDKAIEAAHKQQAQLSALALGTKKLADSGDKYAAAIIEKMKENGITVGSNPPQQAPAGTPAAMTPAAEPAAPANP